MARYAYICDRCGEQSERFAPMAEASTPRRCERCGHGLRRDRQAELPATHAFNAYGSAAAGVPECVMRRAFRVGKNWFVRDRGTPGGRRQLNPNGFRMNPKTGDVLVSNRGEKRRLLKARGLTDYSA